MSKLLLNRSLEVVAIAAVCVLLSGCGRRISTANYERIAAGMTESEVEAILGKGQEQSRSEINIPGQSIDIPGVGSSTVAGVSMTGKSLVWQEGGKIVGVIFKDDKVMSKSQVGL